jgi:catechol 2,3-dioxygenase-like lactoylglutathione lyase family enzyme
MDLEVTMTFRINHIHLKASDPRRTADWYVKAFNFKILSDETRFFGDRFVRCMSEDGGIAVNISGARTGEKLGSGDALPHHGLEHFGFDSANLDADITRLGALGCPLLEGPIQVPNGPRIAFVRGPDDARIELIEPPTKPVSGGCC